MNSLSCTSIYHARRKVVRSNSRGIKLTLTLTPNSTQELHGIKPDTNIVPLMYMIEKPGDHPDFRKNAPGEFRGILGETLGIQKLILGMRNSILILASHDLSSMKTTILGATPGTILGIDGHPHERFSFAPPFSELFSSIGVVPACENDLTGLHQTQPSLAADTDN